MKSDGICGTFVELIAATKMFGFIGVIFRENVDETGFDCYEFGTTDDSDADGKKPILFMLFKGLTDDGHFELLDPMNQKQTRIGYGLFKFNSNTRIKHKYNVLISVTNENFDSSTSGNICHADGNEIESSKEAEDQETRGETNVTTETGFDTKCDLCEKYCKGKRGLAVHIAKKHKTEQRKAIVEKYKPKINAQDEGTDSSEKTPTRPEPGKSEFQLFCELMVRKLDEVLMAPEAQIDKSEALIEEFITNLKRIQVDLPGPKNPATKFYNMRKSRNFQNVERNYNQSSNPQRQSKRDRNKRDQKYNRDRIQWLFYNQRKRAYREIAEENDNNCDIPLDTLYEKFNERWGEPNMKVIAQKALPNDVQEVIDAGYDEVISTEQIKDAIKKTSSDSAPGPDYIIPRTLKIHSNEISPILAKIATLMVKWSYVPGCFKEARTVLGYKGKDRKDPKNWRPFTINSVLRRIIEKVLDRQLRSYLEVSPTQTGFTNQPGTFINTTILQAALNTARTKKRTLVTALLDVTQAYDKVGHAQIEMSMKAQPIPSKLRALALKLDEGNVTQIRTRQGTTKKLNFRCGILQGAPTSPQKFNAATKIVLDELNEREIINEYGFRISDTLEPITNLAFADDTGILGNSRQSASFLISQVVTNFDRIGLEINFEKSVAIIIEEGKLSVDDLVIDDEIRIRALKPNETIRYLGVTFSDQIIMDEERVIRELNEKLNKIVSTTTLRPDQKLKLINIYVFPTLTYSF